MNNSDDLELMEEDEEEYSDEALDKITEKVRGWAEAFSESAVFQELTKEEKEEADFIIDTFAEYMYSYEVLFPKSWNEAGVKTCCTETLPRKVAAGESFFKSIAPVLSRFFIFLEENGFLKNGKTLAKTVSGIERKIVANGADPKHWGMGKSIAMQAEARGFDIGKEDDRAAFMASYNAEQAFRNAQSPVERTKVGRNEPCPCGSGKKYKKCCNQ